MARLSWGVDVDRLQLLAVVVRPGRPAVVAAGSRQLEKRTYHYVLVDGGKTRSIR